MPVRHVAAVLSALLGLAVLAPPAQAAEPLEYVAMGDSYSAGSGVLPPDPTASPLCVRSLLNYPHVLARQSGARLTDVTCGGAETADYTSAQFPGVPPQLDALSASTDLVTMTIGGNDSGVFVDSLLQCSAAAATVVLFQGSPCRDRYGSSFEDTVRDTTYPALVAALQAVRARAPQAEVAIAGYPWIVPATGGCPAELPLAYGDVPYLRGLQTTLNDAVRRAAEATGVTYVDLSVVSDGHDACQRLGVRWVEPLLLGTNTVPVHPNALGERQMAAQFAATLAGA